MTYTKDNENNTKNKYRVKNWKEYNQSLVQRGSLTVWIPENVEDIWYTEGKGRYEDTAIEIILTLKALYSLPLRATEGLARSMFDLMQVLLHIPDYTTLSRRAKKLKVSLKKQSTKENVSIILDSTGVKVYGEGEWKVRKHGWSKRRTWTKIHIGIDSDGEVRTVVTTKNNIHDSTIIDTALNQEQKPIIDFYGDGAYDTAPVYMSLVAHNIKKIHIPPHKNARIRIHGNTNGPPYIRDENLRAIQKSNLKDWKISSGYHRRSLIENTMYRFKTAFGERISFLNKRSQHTEVLIKCNILNTFHSLGMPMSYPIAPS